MNPGQAGVVPLVPEGEAGRVKAGTSGGEARQPGRPVPLRRRVLPTSMPPVWDDVEERYEEDYGPEDHPMIRRKKPIIRRSIPRKSLVGDSDWWPKNKELVLTPTTVSIQTDSEKYQPVGLVVVTFSDRTIAKTRPAPMPEAEAIHRDMQQRLGSSLWVRLSEAYWRSWWWMVEWGEPCFRCANKLDTDDDLCLACLAETDGGRLLEREATWPPEDRT